MFITKSDLMTHLRAENTELITRGEETIIIAAIEGAIAEASGYLGSYDTDAIFKEEGDNRNPLLLIFVKDIAVWHLINLSNNNTAYDKREKRYERAVAWLKDVQRGNITPNLPTKPDTTKLITINGNPKRNEHY